MISPTVGASRPLRYLIFCVAAAVTVTSIERSFAEEEAPESAVSSPPMALDDPATPGAQGIELNLVFGYDRAGKGRETESLFDFNYGIGDRIQLKYERPYVTTGLAGENKQTGLGATKVGVKYRFYENAGWQLGTYPAYVLDDAFTVTNEAGEPEESEGRYYYLPLLVSKTVADINTVAANFGFGRNVDYAFNDLVLGFGVGRALGADLRIMAEVFSVRDDNFANQQTDIRVGISGLLFTGIGLEFPAYVSLGHSIRGPKDADPNTALTVGFSFVKPPKGE